MPNLRGASPVGRVVGGRSGAARTGGSRGLLRCRRVRGYPRYACGKREGPVRGIGFRRAGWQRVVSERPAKLSGRHVDLVKDAVSPMSGLGSTHGRSRRSRQRDASREDVDVRLGSYVTSMSSGALFLEEEPSRGRKIKGGGGRRRIP